jgi:hypothetical protein
MHGKNIEKMVVELPLAKVSEYYNLHAAAWATAYTCTLAAGVKWLYSLPIYIARDLRK